MANLCRCVIVSECECMCVCVCVADHITMRSNGRKNCRGLLSTVMAFGCIAKDISLLAICEIPNDVGFIQYFMAPRLNFRPGAPHRKCNWSTLFMKKFLQFRYILEWMQFCCKEFLHWNCHLLWLHRKSFFFLGGHRLRWPLAILRLRIKKHDINIEPRLHNLLPMNLRDGLLLLATAHPKDRWLTRTHFTILCKFPKTN